MNKILFEKAKRKHQKIIFSWLDEPHVREFWDNRQEHRDDILLFFEGRIKPSIYFNGIFTYWIGSIQNEPFAFLMTAEVSPKEELPKIWKNHLSKHGKTYSIDFCIGNQKFLGKGLASKTLEEFMIFFQKQDSNANTFFIDPDENNPKATHVYEKAGFKSVGKFLVKKGNFVGHNSWLMVKHL